MDHASEIIALDTEKFKIAKKNSDLEIEGERLEQDLLQTRGAIEECEAGLGRKGHGQGQGQGQGQGLPRSASGLESQDQVLLVLSLSFALLSPLFFLCPCSCYYSIIEVHANISLTAD